MCTSGQCEQQKSVGGRAGGSVIVGGMVINLAR
ncbi:unnamed protein product [Ectocarpus sp. CCAP 1310/34]|nr:unnamed protein product [Ectocarpus sp. CCAP 1310/34]